MFLRELFEQKNTTSSLVEGGNVSSRSLGWQGIPGEHKAEEIDLKLHNREFMVDQIRTLLKAQNESFANSYGRPIWDPKLLDSNEMFSGSTLTFFDIKKVSTEDFLNKLRKTKVGDIDTQVDQEIGDDITAWLKSIIGKQIGNGMFIGFNSSLSALWQLQDPPVKIQVDYELGPYQPAQGKEPAKPSEWFAYSHSADYADMAEGIKGVFHKYINRAMTHAKSTTKYVARVLKKSVKISDNPITDSDFSFAVTGSQGGGMSQKYVPYIDPATGKPMEKDGIPVMRLLDPKDRDYIQNLDLQFQINYGKKRTAETAKLQRSFVGTIKLMNKFFNVEQNQTVAMAFLEILFGSGAQMINADDPIRDRDTKFAAVDYMMEHLKLPDAKSLRKQAVDMAIDYANEHLKKKESALNEDTAVKAQLRKGMPHLRDLKPADFLDLLDELHDGNSKFKLENIPLNVKIDGFGGRFGKNAQGKPFMGTSRTEPRYNKGFLKYHQEKGTQDQEILDRAELFDQLFDEMMKAIELVDSKLGPNFLVNKQVSCEVLFLPFAIETDEGKLKFVGIHYDKLPENVKLALVPFHAVEADTGEPVKDPNFIDKLLKVGQQDSVMFINNRLTQNKALDVTALVPPLKNIEQFKSMLASKKRDQVSEVKAALKPVKLALEKAIIEDPNIIGKNILGQDYEGIVINSRLGPIKITSQEQRDIIANKQAAKAIARQEQPRSNQSKVAVVCIGSAIGHMGHQQLFAHAVELANKTGGDPYFFIGTAEGPNDPIPVGDKLKTWHMLYPQYAKNITTVTMDGGSLIQKIKHELINPLPGKSPRYDTIYIVVGADREQFAKQASLALMKAVNKFSGYENVRVIPEVTTRGTGMSGTFLRQVIARDSVKLGSDLIPTKTQEQKFAIWNHAFNSGNFGAKPLSPTWIKHLMDLTGKGMSIKAK